MEDKRFSQIVSDPKFRRIPKAQTKVKIDKRFQSMFTDNRFQVKYTTDKRGRPLKHHSKEDLKRYYEVSSDENSESSENESGNEPGRFVRAPKSIESEEESDESETEGEEDKEDNQNRIDVKLQSDKKISDDIKEKIHNLGIDYARGEQTLFSESSSDDEETDEEISESEEIDHRWGELDADAPRTEEATHRLAACNLDWDRIRALDLMVLFNSFLPRGGIIHSVVIYPSEFGKQRMAEEEIKGPIELVEAKKEEQTEVETEEGSKYHMEKLRQYQLNRLKYYYAVVTFDSVNSANKIYTECDNMEYESSATKMDLRFIPDDITFEDTPKESCSKLPEKYEPRFFTTTALQQAKVELTWDETNPDRLELTEKINKGKLDDISEKELKNYLAESSSEDEVSEHENANENSDSEDTQSGNGIDKYKTLLQDIQEEEEKKKNKDFEMEISWGIDLKEKTDKLMKEKMEKTEEKTPFQKYLDKRKEKRKERKALKKKSKEEKEDSEDSDIPSDIDMNDPYFAEEFDSVEFKKKSNKKKNKKEEIDKSTEEDKQKQGELDLLLMNGDESDQKNHFSLKKIQDNESVGKSKKKKKNNKKNDDKDEQDGANFEINVDDNRFSALFTSHHFNIDPTDPNYKKTKATEKLIREKIKRRSEETAYNRKIKKVKEQEGIVKNKNVELNILVKSVKRKIEGFKNK